MTTIKPGTFTGDVWVSDCRTVTLYCAACEDVLPTLTGVDVCVTDPPYEIVAAGGGIASRKRHMTETVGFTDCGFDYEVLAGFRNWVCFGTLKQVPKLIEAAGDRRWMLLTWNKPNPTPLVSGNYLPDAEYIVHAWRRGGLHGEIQDRSRFIFCSANSRAGGQHPNEKPRPVMDKLIRTSSAIGQVVCDPFMGSGTTGVAAVRLGRRFVGVEIVPRWFHVARKRIRAELERRRNSLFDPVVYRTHQRGLFEGQDE